jgi:hypothetical protein
MLLAYWSVIWSKLIHAMQWDWEGFCPQFHNAKKHMIATMLCGILPPKPICESHSKMGFNCTPTTTTTTTTTSPLLSSPQALTLI